jgi:DNA-directed RNA polymerase subunit M/transcription elongation factor TFIIS
MQHTVTCPSCGAVSASGQQFCGKCGTKLAVEVQQQKIKCPKCGSENLAGQQFCGNCGGALVAAAQQAPATPVQQTPAVPSQEAPAKVVSHVIPRQQVETRPTWGLAWGLWWRMALLGLFIGGVIYLIVAIVMVLGFNYQLPF